MTRETMIRELQSMGFCAVPTVETKGEGLQYDYIMPEGAGNGSGRIGSWPVYVLSGPDSGSWSEIKAKLVSGTLDSEDIAGTELGIFVDLIFRDYYGGQFRKIEINDILWNMTELPDRLPDTLYVIFDMGSAGHGNHRPEFYINKEAMYESFREKYCTYVQPWEDMDDDELQEWYERLSDEFSEFPMNSIAEMEEDIMEEEMGWFNFIC